MNDYQGEDVVCMDTNGKNFSLDVFVLDVVLLGFASSPSQYFTSLAVA